MSLNIGDVYGEVCKVDGNVITIKRIDDKEVVYVNDGKTSTFARWFTTKKKKR